VESKWKNYHITTFLDSLSPKTLSLEAMDLSRDRNEMNEDHLHFWKNWITAPVAVQRHNNTDPLPRERVNRPLPWERAVVMLFASL
jgi:hypothetical protein